MPVGPDAATSYAAGSVAGTAEVLDGLSAISPPPRYIDLQPQNGDLRVREDSVDPNAAGSAGALLLKSGGIYRFYEPVRVRVIATTGTVAYNYCGYP